MAVTDRHRRPIGENRIHFASRKPLTPSELAKLNEDAQSSRNAARPFYELKSGVGSSARREDVVDHKDPLPVGHRERLQLHAGRTVFQIVVHSDDGARKPPALSHGQHSHAHLYGERRA